VRLWAVLSGPGKSSGFLFRKGAKMDEDSLILSDALYELQEIESHLKYVMGNDEGREVNTYYLLWLTEATKEKINYYQKKYNFEIDYHDTFYPENLIAFIRHKDKYYAENGLKRIDELVEDFEKGEGLWAEEAES
jgi:hypothetical protein